VLTQKIGANLHDAVEIHSVNTDSRIILDSEIDVFADTETEVTSSREVSLSQFVFLDLQSTFENFFSFRSSDSDVDSNLFVTTDTEGSDSVSGFACCEWLVIGWWWLSRTWRTVNWGLTTQLFQYFCGTSKSVTRFTNGDVKDEFLDSQLPHGVGALVLFLLRLENMLVFARG
jgi:hypothetical protein